MHSTRVALCRSLAAAAALLAVLCVRPPAPQATPLPDAEARAAMNALAGAGEQRVREVTQQVLAAGDERFVAVYLELLWARRIGLGSSLPAEEAAQALEALSGQHLGEDWQAWVEWYGATALRPPPGYLGWKGALLARIDPALGAFLRDDAPSRLRPEEILWGGVPVDGIPALDHPRTLPAAAAHYLRADEPVFGMALGGEARAYPLRILDWHEMANDVLGGVPFSLSYCTLCGAAIAFRGQAPDGRTYTFGSSGLLYRSNKLMYDRQTRTLWNQLTGEPVLGPLAAGSLRLELLPVVLTTWGAWRAQHPHSTVLDVATGHERPYLPGRPYGEYFASPRTMFPVWRRSGLLPAKSRIYALRLRGVPKAYPLDALLGARVVNDTLAGTAVVLVAAGAEVRVTAERRDGLPLSYSSGAEVRAYERGGATFRPGAEAGTLLDAQGRSWRVMEDALLGPAGERLARLPGHLAYWFGWFAFFPNTQVYGQP